MKHVNIYLCCGVMIFLTGCLSRKPEANNVALSADSIQISFNMQGRGKPAIIFVPGWTNPKSVWDEQVAHFSQKYRSVAIDLPGCGASGNNRTDWTMKAFGNDVISVINKLKLDEVVLVGFSMGTAVVVEAANLIPEKVIGVVLVDDLKDPDMRYPPEILQIYDSIMMDLVTNMTNEKLINLGFYKHNPDSSFKRIESMYEGVSHAGWEESLQGYFKWSNEDITGALQQLKVPVTAIYSDMEPTNIEASKKIVPGFQAKIMTDVGHLLFWDKPDEFNRLLEETIKEFIKSSAAK
jgi:pimeloyl-ACP methyl ester carboxylesterase